MNFILKPSLEHMALVKIAVTLWNQEDVRNLISEFPEWVTHWSVIESLVIEKVSQLSLPERLKEKILNFIKPIGVEILKWIEFHQQRCDFTLGLPRHFQWTPQGTIHTKRTMKEYVEDEKGDVFLRYKLACIYCLENHIVALWKRIPADYRFLFYNEDFSGQKWLIYLWTCDINNEMDKMERKLERMMRVKCSPYQYAFAHAAGSGNKLATQYFYDKLTLQEIDESLVLTTIFTIITHYYHYRKDFPKEPYSDIIFFLLSKMHPEQQIRVFRSSNYKLLACLLDWPYQVFFMKAASFMWDFLADEGYERLLRIVANKIVNGFRDYNYQRLLREFRQRNPNSHKRIVLNDDECITS